MHFLENNHDISIGDDFALKIGGKEIPWTDFIDIMQYLMNADRPDHISFYPTLDTATEMPLGTKWFIDAIYHVIEKKPLSKDITDEEKNNFAQKFNEFAGTAAHGVKHILTTIQKDLRQECENVNMRNLDDTMHELDELMELEDEQERAQQLMEDIQLEEDIVRERQAKKDTLSASAKRSGKNCGKRILRRIGLEREDLGEGTEAAELRELYNKNRRRKYQKAVRTIAERMSTLGGPETIVERQMRKYYKALQSGDPAKLERYQSPDIWERTYEMSV